MGFDYSPAPVPGIETHPDRLTLTWSAGDRSTYLYYWLRENCRCPKCTHPEAWERIVDFMAIPLDIKPATCSADAAGLHLTWPAHGAPCDGTNYSWEWLHRHRSERATRLARRIRHTAWTDAVPRKENLSIPFSGVMDRDADLQRLLEHVDSTGLGFVTEVPTDDLAVIRVAERIAFVEESHFGRYFDVVSKANPENLAYTPEALRPHNDLSSRQHLPGVQLLHCRRNEVAGGDSVLVDGIAAAERLRCDDPEAFAVLSTRRVTFRSVANDWEITNRATIIEVDDDGDIVGTRLHPALLGPLDIEPDDQPAFYRAHRALLDLALDPEMQLRFRLNEGDCMIFDNTRILHARSAFDASTGNRHLQGCYLGRDDLRSRLNVLRRGEHDYRSS